MNRKIGFGVIALLAIILILGTVGYNGLHRNKWNAKYYRNTKEMVNYRTWQDEHECLSVMGKGYYQEGVPFVSKGGGMMYYRIGHDEHRHEGGGTIGILVLLLVAFGAYHFFSKREKNNKPLDILKERFARGEITREQYEEMKKVLE